MKKLAMLALLSALCAFGVDVTGKWVGTVEATRSDGSTSTDDAIFDLKQDGATLTGTGGGASDNFPIQNGKVEGDAVTFDILAGEKGVFKISLKVADETLTGNATRERNGNTQTAKLTLKRQK